MGDRYCVGFTGYDEKDNPERRVWLYSHWGGSDRHNEIGQAIEAARGRWTDPTYATRIAISSIVADGWKEETGYGIEAGPECLTHVEYGAFLVNWSDKTVTEFDYVGFGEDEWSTPLGSVVAVCSFDDFMAGHSRVPEEAR